MTERVQPGILAPIPPLACYLTFSLAGDPGAALRRLDELADGERLVVGFGDSLLRAIGRPIDGMRGFPGGSAPGLDVPATPAALWCWLRGDDRGDLLHAARSVAAAVAPALRVDAWLDAF